MDDAPQRVTAVGIGQSREPDRGPAERSAAALCWRSRRDHPARPGAAVCGALSTGTAAHGSRRSQLRPSMLLGGELDEDLYGGDRRSQYKVNRKLSLLRLPEYADTALQAGHDTQNSRCGYQKGAPCRQRQNPMHRLVGLDQLLGHVVPVLNRFLMLPHPG